MPVHHTKTKGDLGVLHAQLDLVTKGFMILLPQTEHAPFDLVAYRDGRFLRVQVKYRAAVNGVVTFPFASSWADKNGSHTKPVDRSSIDVYAVYCPDTGRCYYVDPRSTPTTKLSLRIAPSRNGQTKHVSAASDFTEIPDSVVGCSSPVVAMPAMRQSLGSATRP